ncbi:conjugal transfer protein TraD [Sphingomonas sp. JC676]|nr:conjugal transfer protein TraD [Sphingomonas sp. JC676]MBC9031831.1 conjugal transfer protein TraD [Sphingomonas sp. JC676]
MRKPRDFDSEMKALNERAKLLKERKLHQLGELVIAAGADVLAVDVLAGAMLAAAETKDAATVEVWRKRGAAFFQSASRSAVRRNRGDVRRAPAGDGSAQPPFGGTSTN